MSYVSFEDFVKSRKWVESLRASCAGFGSEDEDSPGFVYMNEFFVYDNSASKTAAKYSWVVTNQTGVGSQISDVERDFYMAVKDYEGWKEEIDVVFNVTLRMSADTKIFEFTRIMDWIQTELENCTELGIPFEVMDVNYSHKI